MMYKSIPMAGPIERDYERAGITTATPFTREDIFSIGATILYLNREEPALAKAIGVKLPNKRLAEFVELGKQFSLAHPQIARDARDARASVGPHIDDLIVDPNIRPYMLGVDARTGIHSFRGEVFRMLAGLDSFQLRNLKQMALGLLPYNKPRA
jgi:hypothetical protein